MDTLVYAPSVSLDDKYLVEGHQVFITGVQVLVRLPMLRREADARNGLNTADLPPDTVDRPTWHLRQTTLARAAASFRSSHRLSPRGQRGTRRDRGLGQPAGRTVPRARYDGVFGIWYGKAPGVDRSGDAFKHANFAGTARRAACWPWPATTTPASPRPCRTRANSPSRTSRCRC